MATSDAAICNISLRMLREQPITSLSEDSTRAKVLRSLYPDARDYCLAMHPWNFAKRRVANLNRNADAPAFGFDYAFALPSNPYCLRVVQINETPGIVFKVEGRDLLTNESEVDIEFIARITDVSSYSPGFDQTLAAYLAWQSSYAFTGSQTRTDALEKAFDKICSRARMLDGIEDVQDDAPVSPFVAIRS